jgi:hypothetical protein
MGSFVTLSMTISSAIMVNVAAPAKDCGRNWSKVREQSHLLDEGESIKIWLFWSFNLSVIGYLLLSPQIVKVMENKKFKSTELLNLL